MAVFKHTNFVLKYEDLIIGKKYYIDNELLQLVGEFQPLYAGNSRFIKIVGNNFYNSDPVEFPDYDYKYISLVDG